MLNSSRAQDTSIVWFPSYVQGFRRMALAAAIFRRAIMMPASFSASSWSHMTLWTRPKKTVTRVVVCTAGTELYHDPPHTSWRKLAVGR